MRITNTHVYFWGGIYSNWYSCAFLMNDLEFENTEQAFMYQKAKFFDDIETAREILATPNPKAVKLLGRSIKNYNDDKWADARLEAMVFANERKFGQNYSLRKELLSTAPKILVEASPVDKIWGVGLAEDNDLILDEKNWLGQNLLGKALMEVRDNLK